MSVYGACVIRFLHTRIRVKDIEASIAFYLKLGYQEGVRKASPQGNQLAFWNYATRPTTPLPALKISCTLVSACRTSLPTAIKWKNQGSKSGPLDGAKNFSRTRKKWHLSPIPMVTRWKFSNVRNALAYNRCKDETALRITMITTKNQRSGARALTMALIL
jgi:hypothetical protein